MSKIDKDLIIRRMAESIYNLENGCPLDYVDGFKCAYYDVHKDCPVGSKDVECWIEYYKNGGVYLKRGIHNVVK